MKTLFFSLLLISSLTIAQDKSDLETLANWMSGSFNSYEQSVADSDYYNITLEMAKIWPERTDGYWIYVEQAVAQNKDKPYRQRIYNLVEKDEGIYSIIYSIPNESEFTGGWKDVNVFNKISRDVLEIRKGCEVVIHRKDDNTFIGNSIAKNCTSNLRGATYATTEVEITKDKLVSWDRGFDDNDNQVWGAEKGGYIFNKVK